MRVEPENWPIAKKESVVKPWPFVLALVASLVIYYFLFGYVLHKPQTIGRTRDLFEAKDAALEAQANEPKIILVGGSNVRTSHSARVIEEEVGRATINMGVSAGLSMDFQLNRLKPYLSSGDIIYMPLEYGQLARDQKTVYSGSEAPYAVAYERESLSDFSLMRQLHAYLYFDIRFLFSALAEMGLSAVGYERRITADDFNEWGDQTGHSLEKGEPYRNYIQSIKASPTTAVDTDSFSAISVAEFLDWALENDVIVVGGWPTYADGAPIKPEAEARLKDFYESRGHYFLDLENKGRYPKSHFFDTIYHLAEPYQIEHSKFVGERLQDLLEL